MTVKNISVRMGTEKIEQIDRLAAALGRSRAWVLNQAADRYLAYEEWFLGQVQEGLADAENGDVFPQDDVMATLRRKLDKAGDK